MSIERSVLLTADGKARLESDLKQLRDVRLRELFRSVQDANTNNEASDSSEYEELKDELAYTEARVRDLEQLLENAEVIAEGSPDGIVAIGSHVTVKGDDGVTETWIAGQPGRGQPFGIPGFQGFTGWAGLAWPQGWRHHPRRNTRRRGQLRCCHRRVGSDILRAGAYARAGPVPVAPVCPPRNRTHHPSVFSESRMELSELQEIRRQKADELRSRESTLIPPAPTARTRRPGPAPCSRPKTAPGSSSMATQPEPITVTGRIVSLRHMGKTVFAHIRDGHGQLQLYLRRTSSATRRSRDFLKLFDLGDFVQATGTFSGPARARSRCASAT